MQDPTGGALSGGSAPADDGGGLAGITIDAGGFADDGAADTFRVYRSGEGVGVSVNGNEVFSGILGDSDTLTILGSSDADRLLVELGPDGLPTTQIQFDAGDQPAGSRDLLVLTGSSTSVTHTIGSVGDGHASANGAEIAYQGVEDLHDRVDSAIKSIRLAEVETAQLSGSIDGELQLDAGSMRLSLDRPSDRLSVDLSSGVATTLSVNSLGSNLQFDVDIHGDSDDTVNHSGTSQFATSDFDVEAGTIELGGAILSDGGRLTFGADSALNVTPDAMLDSRGGYIELNAGPEGLLTVHGQIDVSDDAVDGIGGEVRLLGSRVGLLDMADVNASGTLGGGTILVGGDYQGGNPDIPNAVVTVVGPDATLTADATEHGNGGKIIIWADVATAFAGAVLARGGEAGGNGGFVEISGKRSLYSRGHYDLSAPNGRVGTLLFDPSDIQIVGGTMDGNDPGPDSGTLNQMNLDNFNNAGPTPFLIYESEIEGTAADIVLRATDSITVTGVFDGGLTIAAGHHLTLETQNQGMAPTLGIDLSGLTINVSAGGNIRIATGAGMGMSHASNVQTGSIISNGGLIEIESSGDVEIDGTIDAGAGDVMITAGGQIIDGTPDDSAVNIRAASATLVAQSGIGDALLLDIDLDVISVSARTTTGNINLHEQDTLVVAAILPNGLEISDDTGGGNIVVTVDDGPLTINGAVFNAALDVRLDVVGASAMDDLVINANVTSANGSIALVAGRDIVQGSAGSMATVSTDAGMITYAAGRSISLGSDASIVSDSGDIRLENGPSTAGSTHIGIAADSATIETSTGSITLIGRGGDTGDGNLGVQLSNGSKIESGGGAGAGAISVTGIAGSGMDSTFGVVVTGAGSIIASVDAAITVVGTGGGSGAGNVGVFVADGGAITTTGNGAITVTGDGASGTNLNAGVVVTGANSAIRTGGQGSLDITGHGHGTGSGNDGVRVDDGGQIEGSGAGVVNVIGIAANGTSNNVGIRVEDADSRIASTDGMLGINATAGIGGSNNHGLLIASGAIVEASGTGAIEVIATAGAGASVDDNVGLLIAGANSSLMTNSGSLDVTATGGGTGMRNDGVRVEMGGEIEGGANGVVNIRGTAAAGSGDNVGIRVVNTGSRIASTDGLLSINATGGAGGSGSHGLSISLGGDVEATGDGGITVIAIAGLGTDDNVGVSVHGTGSAISTVNGAISVTGTGGDSGDRNYGVAVTNSGSIVATGDGTVMVTGIGGSAMSASDNVGVLLLDNGSRIASTAGSLTVVGTGRGTATGNHGVRVERPALIASGTGALQVTGTGANGTSGVLLRGDGTFPAVGEVHSTTGTITVTSATGDLEMVNVAGITSNSGRINAISTVGNVLLNVINANADGGPAGNVSISALNGQIIDDLSSEELNIIGDSLALNAGSGIGNFDATSLGQADFDIDVQVNNLAATTVTGDIFIWDLHTLTINTAGFDGVVGVSITTGGVGDDIMIIEDSNAGSVDPFTISATVANRGAGNITLVALDSDRKPAAGASGLVIHNTTGPEPSAGRVVASGGDIRIFSEGDVVIARSGAGALSEIDSGAGDVYINAGVVFSLEGIFVAGDSQADIAMGNQTQVVSAAGQVLFEAARNIALGQVNTGSAYFHAVAHSGRILDASLAETPNIIGAGASLRAAIGIGTDAFGETSGATDIDTQVAVLAASTDSGDLHVQNTIGLEIGTVPGIGAPGIDINEFHSQSIADLSGITIVDSVVPLLNDGASDIQIRASGALTVNHAVLNNDAGDITLAAEGNTEAIDLTLAADVTTIGTRDDLLFGTTSGNVRLFAGDSIFLEPSRHVITRGEMPTDGNGFVRVEAGVNFNGGDTQAGTETGDIVMAIGSTIQTVDLAPADQADGNIVLRATGDTTLTLLNADADDDAGDDRGDVVVHAGIGSDGIGSIIDGTNDLEPEAANIVARRVALGAASGIGNGLMGDAADIDLDAHEVAAHTLTGNINLHDLDSLDITTFGSVVGVTIDDAAATGNISVLVESGILGVRSEVRNDGSGDIVLDANGVTSADDLEIEDNVLAAGGGDIVLEAGGDILQGTTPTTSLVSTNGQGRIDYKAGRGILLDPQASVSSQNGVISLQNFANYAENHVGIDLNDAEITTVRGEVILDGQGGSGGNGNIGVRLRGGSSVVSTGETTGPLIANAIRLDGHAGTGVDDNVGVHIGGSSLISSADAPIHVNGHGLGTGDRNHGIVITAGSAILSSSNGPVMLEGTTESTSLTNNGVRLDSGAAVESTAGNVQIRGVRTAFDASAHSVLIDATMTIVQSSTGSITIEAYGGDLLMNNASRVRSQEGMIWLFSHDDVWLGIVSTGGNVSIQADSDGNGQGGVLDNLLGEAEDEDPLNPDLVNVTAGNLVVRASSGIGAGTGILGELEDIDVWVTGALNAFNASHGHIQFFAVDDANIGQIWDLSESFAVVVEATAAITDATIGAPDAPDGILNVIAGAAVLRATSGIGGDLHADLDTRIVVLWAVNTHSGDIGIAEEDAVVFTTLAQLRGMTDPLDGDITLVAGSTIDGFFGDGALVEGTGSIILRSTGDAGSSLIRLFNPIEAKPITGDQGSVLLQANDAHLGALINAGIVQITPHSNSGEISLGADFVGSLSLSDAELDLVVARVLTIGGLDVDGAQLGSAADAGAITVRNVVKPDHTSTVFLLTEDIVTGTAIGSIGASDILAKPGTLIIDTRFGVNGASNGRLSTDATILIGRVRDAGNFSVVDKDALTIGSVPTANEPLVAYGLNPLAGASTTPLDGVQTSNGSLLVSTTTGALTVLSPVQARGGAATAALVAGASGDLLLHADVISAHTATLFAGGSILQPTPDKFIDAIEARLESVGGDVGEANDPIELRVDVVSAFAPSGSIYLVNDAVQGGLQIGPSPSLPGIAAGGLVVVTAPAGPLVVVGSIQSSSVALSSNQQIVVNAAITAIADVELTAAREISVAGTILATNVTARSGTDFVIGAPVIASSMADLSAVGAFKITRPASPAVEQIAAQTLHILAGGQIDLGGTIRAHDVARIKSTSNAIIQSANDVYVTASRVAFIAPMGVGADGAAIDLRAGTVAAYSESRGIYLNEDGGIPGTGDLRIGQIDGSGDFEPVEGLQAAAIFDATATGVPLVQVSVAESLKPFSNIVVTTEDGNLILAHRVIANKITVEAHGVSELKQVLFDMGYMETPTGRVVGRLVVTPDFDEIRLDSSLSTIFWVDAGSSNVLTVDGPLSDRNLTVEVNFRQPEEGYFTPFMTVQSFTDSNSALVNQFRGFGPYQFRYDDLFLFEQNLLAGSRRELFDIIVTGMQDDSIIAREFLNNQVNTVTMTTTAGSTVETTPLNIVQSPIALILEFHVSPPVALPSQSMPDRIFDPPFIAMAAPDLGVPPADDSDLVDITAASSSIIPADRPRFFLVGRLPGLETENQFGPMEVPIVVLSIQHRRALVAQLPQGRFWFERQDPGGEPYQIGESFYVRGGREIIDVPAEDLGTLGIDVPVADADDLATDGVDQNTENDDLAFANSAAAGAAMFGAVGLLRGRWRRRFEMVDELPAPRLGKAGRLSRRVLRAAR